MRPRFLALFALTLSVGVFSHSPAHAQVDDATTTADPSRAQQELLTRDLLPKVTPNIEITDTIKQEAPEGAESVVFELNTIQVDGVTVYNANDLDPIYRGSLGTEVTLAEVYAIANKITNKYRNDGYVLTQTVVPPQTIDGGSVRLQVVEGFINEVIVEGDETEKSKALIEEYAGHLQGGTPMNAGVLERYLLLINDLPGVEARSILRPSRTVTGAADLVIIVERKKTEVYVGFDNFGSRYLGEYETSVGGAINSLFGVNDRLGAQFVMAGDHKESIDELMFGSVTYDIPVSKYGTKLRFLASLTSTEPGYDLREFDVKGRSQLLGVTVSHPFVRSRNLNLVGYGTFDMKQVESKNNLEPTRNDRIRSVRLGSQLQFVDTVVGVGVNSAGFEISQGLTVFNASKKSDPDLTRQFGDPQYFKAELNLQRLQRVTSNVNVLVAGQGQWSAVPLLSSEEFGVGGFGLGRGYDPSEIVGDDGIAGKIEVQWNEPTKLSLIHDYQLYTFFDIGRVWNQDATTSANKRESISSTGLGIRADITDKTKAGFAVAFPLTRDVDTRRDKDPRFYVNLNHEF